MVRLSKSFDSFNALKADLRNSQYSDNVIGFVQDIDGIYDEDENALTYDRLLELVVTYLADNRPGIDSIAYPNCISFAANSYGFKYMKDNIGINIMTRANRKTGQVTYTLAFEFNKEPKFLKTHPVFVYAMEEEYTLEELGKKK